MIHKPGPNTCRERNDDDHTLWLHGILPCEEEKHGGELAHSKGGCVGNEALEFKRAQGGNCFGEFVLVTDPLVFILQLFPKTRNWSEGVVNAFREGGVKGVVDRYPGTAKQYNSEINQKDT